MNWFVLFQAFPASYGFDYLFLPYEVEVYDFLEEVGISPIEEDEVAFR